MIGSVSSYSSVIRQGITSPSPVKGASFSATLAASTLAATDSPSAAPIVSISADAQAKAASQISTFDTNLSNITHSWDEIANHAAEGARLVSQAQGLPEGQYDFSKLSAKQAAIVLRDASMNHGATWEDGLALSNFISDGTDYSQTPPSYSDTPGNAIAHTLGQSISFGDGEFDIPKDSLAWLMSLQGAALPNELQKTVDDTLDRSNRK